MQTNVMYEMRFQLRFAAFLLLVAPSCCEGATPRSVIAPPGITTTKTLDQNWSNTEAEWFYNVPQGSRLVPYSWFLHLEQATSEALVNDAVNMRQYGLLPRAKDDHGNPDGLPIGFVKDRKSNELGFTCAACHTNTVHYQGTAFLVDGAPTLADIGGFLRSLETALKATLDDASKFDRFANMVLQHPSAGAKAALRARLRTVYSQRAAYNERNFPPAGAPQFGSGRIDAFGAIMNEVSVRFIGHDDNFRAGNAPVSYPFLWDTPQHPFVQWNGAAENNRSFLLKPLLGTSDIGALGRNAGEVLGVFGDLEVTQTIGLIGGYSSSIDSDRLIEIEDSLKGLWSPKWPAELPKLNTAKIASGRTVFVTNCSGCHADIERDNPSRDVKAKMEAVGTDQTMAANFATRVAETGPLEGRKQSLTGLHRFGPQAAMKDILLHVVQRLLVGPLLTTEADIVPLSTGVEQFQLAINAEIQSKGSRLKGSFREARVQDGRVRSFAGGHNIEVLQQDQQLSLRISPETGIQIPESAQAKNLLDKATKTFKLSAEAQGASVSDLDQTTIEYQYKARPLNGIWATSPYLHNGSVPSLAELLKKPEDRVKLFFVGDHEFIPAEVGFRYDQGPSKLDTNLPGNSNSGHNYGTGLLPEQRDQLLEYLKSL